MEYRRIGNSGLRVSEIGLGGGNFGARANEEVSINVINHALELGINFIDTSSMYVMGRSEEIIGQAVSGKRSQVIIATKFGHPSTVGPREQGGSRSFIMKAIDGSLRRLNTDYIDLYYMHHPDPDYMQSRPGAPIEETLRTLDELVKTGKVRYIGYSNCAAWQICDALWTSKVNNLVAFIALEAGYNLLDRSIERELIPCCKAHSIGLVAYGPLARGFLTGKYRRGQEMPAGTYITMALADPVTRPIFSDILSDANFDKLAKLEAFAKERGHTVGELAIAWILANPCTASVLAGGMNTDQVSANVAAIGLRLSEEDVSEVYRITHDIVIVAGATPLTTYAYRGSL